MVSITMVSDNDCFVILCFSGFDYIFHTSINSNNSFFDCFVNAGMTYHITVSKVYYDEVIFVFIDSSHQFVFYFVSAHFRLQVVSSNFRRRNKNTVFVIVRSFTATVEEECYVSILFCFCNMELIQSLSSKVFTQRIRNVFFIE